jgi:hypothetical protein
MMADQNHRLRCDANSIASERLPTAHVALSIVSQSGPIDLADAQGVQKRKVITTYLVDKHVWFRTSGFHSASAGAGVATIARVLTGAPCASGISSHLRT